MFALFNIVLLSNIPRCLSSIILCLHILLLYNSFVHKPINACWQWERVRYVTKFQEVVMATTNQLDKFSIFNIAGHSVGHLCCAVEDLIVESWTNNELMQWIY